VLGEKREVYDEYQFKLWQTHQDIKRFMLGLPLLSDKEPKKKD